MAGPKKSRLAQSDGAVVGIFVPIDEETVSDLLDATADLEDESEDLYEDEYDDDEQHDDYE